MFAVKMVESIIVGSFDECFKYMTSPPTVR